MARSLWQRSRFALSALTLLLLPSIVASDVGTAGIQRPIGTGIFWTTVTLTNSQITNIHTTPVLLVNGVSGYMYLPFHLYIRKTAGTAYTIVTGADLAACHGSNFYIQLECTGLLDQAGETRLYRTLAAINNVGDNPANYRGANLTLCQTGGSFTGSGSNVDVTVGYYTVYAP